MALASAQRPPIELTRDTRIVAAPDQVSAELEGETVMLSMSEGVYYGLDRVGTFIWRRLASPVALGTLHDAVVAEYEVGADRAWEDLVALTRDLLANALIVPAAADRG